MKILIALVCLLAVISTCSDSPSPPKFYGQTFDTTNVITVTELVSKMQGKSKVAAIVEGNVTESCQSEGCWLNMKNDGAAAVFVDWDHNFNTPKDLTGKRVLAFGYAYIDSTKTEAVIAFKATGVYL
ncbi:MAG: DUF4920 domain-containing protein [Chitinophagales bacterium]